MSYSTTLIQNITTPSSTPQYGKISPVSVTEAMDVDQRPAASSEKKPLISSTVVSSTTHPPQPHSADISPTGSPPTISQPEPVLERPREANGFAQQQQQQQQQQQPPATPERQKAQLPQPSQYPRRHISHLSTNLISVFKLDPLAATVARFDPVTGEKINKMRKSYEGHLKTLGLAGKNKSIKHEEANTSGKMMGLSEIAAWPEEEWQNQKVHGRSVHQGLPDSVKAKLEKAMDLRPGPVTDGAKWEDILGIDKVVPNAGKGRKDSKVNGQIVNGVTATTQPSAPAAEGATNEHIRARRNTKKRRYDDGSFEGYGEGFVDDDLDLEMGYTSGETYTSRNSRGDKKRRKTKDFVNSPTTFGGNSTSPNSNIGPYGR